MTLQADRADRADGTPLSGAAPVVIGHRGACGHRPENTLESFRLAIALGADSVEPDVVSTRDRVLVVRHENELSATTDVADRPEYAARRTTRTVDGARQTGWFVEDFTLAELKTLRARERHPWLRRRNATHDGRYEVPTLQEVIDLVLTQSVVRGRPIGIHAELKHATYFAGRGLCLAEPLLRTLGASGLDTATSQVCVQSFETTILRRLATMTRVPLVQLVEAGGAPHDLSLAGDPRTYDDLLAPAGLDWVAGYASAVSVHTSRVIPVDRAGRCGPATSLVADAHARGLAVLVWTLRNENRFLAECYRTSTEPDAFGDVLGETRALLDLGVDGLFTDHPDTSVLAREIWLSGARSR